MTNLKQNAVRLIVKYRLGIDLESYPEESWDKVERLVSIADLVKALDEVRNLGNTSRIES